jgi:hypothetical protein
MISTDKPDVSRANYRLKIGEVGRNGDRRKNFSSRAAKGNLDVIKKTCPYCKHKKIFSTFNGLTKCCKCKRRIEVKK